MDLAEQLREDIRRFKDEHGLDRLVMVWCGSTEIYLTESPVHASIEAFEKALEANDPCDSVEHGVRLRRAQGRRSVREWRAEPDAPTCRR